MNDQMLRARLQDLREGHTGNPERGALAFTPDARWRDNADEPWIEGAPAIESHLGQFGDRHELWDPWEVVVEGDVALVRFRLAWRSGNVATSHEGWARVGLGEDHLTSWDAIWTALPVTLDLWD